MRPEQSYEISTAERAPSVPSSMTALASCVRFSSEIMLLRCQELPAESKFVMHEMLVARADYLPALIFSACLETWECVRLHKVYAWLIVLLQLDRAWFFLLDTGHEQRCYCCKS